MNSRKKELERKVCEGCGSCFSAVMPHARFCSARCYGIQRYAKADKEFTCKECGSLFTSKQSKAICCSENCKAARVSRGVIAGAESRKHLRKHASRADAYKLYDYQRRSLVASRESESFSAVEIFERDGWLCQICTEEIDRSLAWPHRRSVSLDHIVPIAGGGRHVRSNVQCAHLGCNSAKGASLPRDHNVVAHQSPAP